MRAAQSVEPKNNDVSVKIVVYNDQNVVYNILMKLKHNRKERLVNPADPTVVVEHIFKSKRRLHIILTEFFGDICCKIKWNGREKLFTSVSIHPWLNKLATKIFNRYEDAYQAARQAEWESWDRYYG